MQVNPVGQRTMIRNDRADRFSTDVHDALTS